MALLHVPLNTIDEARLQALINAEAAESRSIEYKRTTYGGGHADYSEFLADVSSFANTSGGDLIIGMGATDGIPTAFSPLVTPMDAEILRLEQIARGGLQPRITNVAFQPVPIKSGGQVLIVRVPRSYTQPHRVVRQGSNRFWARSAAGKYELDVAELRTLFTAGPQLVDRIRNFRLDRIAKIVAGQAPVNLMDGGAMTFHVVPLSAFDTATDLPLQRISRDFNSFSPIGSRTPQAIRINFDGVLKTSNADQASTRQRAYVQLFRTGIVEAVASSIISTSKGEPILFNLDDTVIFDSVRYLNDLADVGVEPPYALLVSLIGVKGARCHLTKSVHSAYYDNLGDALDRDQYHFAEAMFESIPNTPGEYAAVVRPMLDQLANAAGSPSSPSFDAQGRFISKHQ